jgi:hypothetical protein
MNVRGIKDLTQDEFFDAHQALLPLIPHLLNTEVYRAFFFGNLSRELIRAGIERVNKEGTHIEASIDMLIRDHAALADIFTRKEFRGDVREFLGVMTGQGADEVATLSGIAFKQLITKILSDKDFHSFLAFAELPELTELPPSSTNKEAEQFHSSDMPG